MIIIDDNSKCPKCGGYFEDNGYCVNGHIKSLQSEENELPQNGCSFCCHFDTPSGFNDVGQCRCSTSKYYMDIVSKKNICDKFSLL